jgi:hypothetical protein
MIYYSILIWLGIGGLTAACFIGQAIGATGALGMDIGWEGWMTVGLCSIVIALLGPVFIVVCAFRMLFGERIK